MSNSETDTTDEILLNIFDDLDKQILKPEETERIENMASSTADASLAEQEKIWLAFLAFQKDFPQSKQASALETFICSETVSPKLQKKAINEFARKSADLPLDDYIVSEPFSAIAAATQDGNEDNTLALADNILNREDCNTDILFNMIEKFVIKDKNRQENLTDRFINNPRPYLTLLERTVEKDPLTHKARALLAQIHSCLEKKPAENIVPLFAETVKNVLNTQKNAEIEQINKKYAAQEKLLNLPTAQERKIPLKSHIRE